MKCTLIGIKPVDFNNNEGQRIHGQTAYIEYKDSKVFGMAMDKIFLTGDLELAVMPSFPVTVNVEFFKNKLTDFQIIK